MKIENIILLIYPILLLFITFYKCKLSPIKTFSSDFWSRAQSKNLQAAASIGIILHHITQINTHYANFSATNPITLFNNIGILFTSIFFFFSGYGLILNVYNKENYLNNFFWHRLPLILVPFYSINTIFVFINFFCYKRSLTNIEFIKCITGFSLLNGNSWFIIELVYLYIAFFIFFKLIKNKNIALILLILATITIIRISYVSGHSPEGIVDLWFKGEWWYNSTVTFILGLIFARFNKSITTFAKRFYKLLISVFLIIFPISFILEEHIRINYGYYNPIMFNNKISGQLITFLFQSLLSTIFIILILLINMKISINNKLLNFIGTISIELYLIHELILENLIKINKINIVLLYFFVIILSFIAAFLINRINIAILQLINKFTKDKEYHTENDKDLLRKAHKKKLKKEKK